MGHKMKLEDFRFRLTDTKTGASALLSFDDLYGYEGEVCGVLVDYRDHIPKEMRGAEISYNSGCAMDGLREGWEIEVVDPADEE